MADGDSRAGSAVRRRSGRLTRPSSGTKRNRLTVDVVLPPGVRAAGLAAWLQSVAPARARGTMTVAIVPDNRVRALNRQYRNTNTKTDVLSFPAEDHAA